MNFLEPLWLIAAAAVSIPVIIHLWNIKTGKTLKVGSISLISGALRKQSRSFRISDIILLLLRCLLLCLLAFVLGMPYYKMLATGAKSKGWLLVPKENFKEVYQKFKPLTDSLLKAGYEMRDFGNGFPPVDIKQLLTDTTKQGGDTALSYWDRVRQLNVRISPALSVYLVTPATLKKFKGERPEIAFNLHWKTYTKLSRDSLWIQSAWFAANKDVHVLQGKSSATGTGFTSLTIAPGSQRNSPYVIDVTGGRPQIRLKNSDQKPVAIDTAALTVDVFADSKIDAGYLKAVLKAGARFSQRNLVVKNFNGAHGPAQKGGWLFWLSGRPLAKNISGHYSNILVYGPGKAMAVNSWISDGDVYALPQGQRQTRIYKLTAVNNLHDDILWHDGFGAPVLTCRLDDKTTLYHFYSRFDPSWNELVWSAEFPKMMLPLLFHNNSSALNIKYDNRTIDSKQVLPERSGHVDAGRGNYTNSKDLAHYFWLLLTLVFLTERWMVYKDRTIKTTV